MSHTLFKILFVTFFLVTSLESKAQLAFNYTVENGAIPADFGKDENAVLVCVLHGEKGYDKYLMKNVEKSYHGKYVFVPFDERHSGKYADTSLYQYAFDMREIVKNGVNGTIFTRTFFVVDRRTWKRYSNSGTSSLFGKMITAYMTALEKVRLENQGKK